MYTFCSHVNLNKFAQTMLERLERERDTARADVERLIEERDALRERLKVARKSLIRILNELNVLSPISRLIPQYFHLNTLHS